MIPVRVPVPMHHIPPHLPIKNKHIETDLPRDSRIGIRTLRPLNKRLFGRGLHSRVLGLEFRSAVQGSVRALCRFYNKGRLNIGLQQLKQASFVRSLL